MTNENVSIEYQLEYRYIPSAIASLSTLFLLILEPEEFQNTGRVKITSRMDALKINTFQISDARYHYIRMMYEVFTPCHQMNCAKIEKSPQ